MVRLFLALSFVGLAAASAARADDVGRPRSEVLDPYRPIVERICRETLKSNDAWNKMEQLCDGIGHRLSGSEGLENAVAWAADAMRRDGLTHVRTEPVMVTKWVRGRESAAMISPRQTGLTILGLGGSIGTPPDGLTAPALVVQDESEFEALGDQVAGKIVLFNNPMPPYDPEKGARYGTAVRFRGKGPAMAARRGAVACLVRSVTANSLQSPHTGATRYEDGVKKIPAAAISIEDAELIARLTERGTEVRINLKMEARTEGQVPSANVVGELRGREKPEEIVVIGGHIDSWDVGTGAHDDAGGCVAAMEAAHVLRSLDLIPRRTIRVVLWTNEENGLGGARAYVRDHADELKKHVAAIESDSGVFQPLGFGIQCADTDRQARAAIQLNELLALLDPLGRLTAEPGYSGADIGPMRPAGVALLGLRVEGSNYFDYHHSHADTLDKVAPEDLSKCVAAMAATAYLLADMPGRLGDDG